MFDWLLSFFSGNARITSEESGEGQGQSLRKVQSMPAIHVRESSPKRSSLYKDENHSRSTASLKNESMMLEAQRLFLSLGIAMTSRAGGKNHQDDDSDDDEVRGDRKHYRNLDVIYHHPQGNGRVFVGNDRAAGNMSILQRNKITHIVNCTYSVRVLFYVLPSFLGL
jgi:hypothetical protein